MLALQLFDKFILCKMHVVTVPCQTNEITECVLLSILLRQLFSSCAKPLANSLYEVQTTIDSFLLLFELNPLSSCIDVLPVLFNILLELPFFSARTFLFTASLADCLLLEGVTFFLYCLRNFSYTGFCCNWRTAISISCNKPWGGENARVEM